MDRVSRSKVEKIGDWIGETWFGLVAPLEYGIWRLCPHRAENPEFNYLVAKVDDLDDAILMGKLFLLAHDFGGFGEIWITEGSTLIAIWGLEGEKGTPKLTYEQKVKREPYFQKKLDKALKIIRKVRVNEN